VYELPLSSPQSRGKSLVNVLPFGEQETLSTLMHLPEDPAIWQNLHILFVTSAGHVRRNALSDFQNIRSSGKIAMKLEEEGERLIAVQTCREDQDVLLTTRKGRSIRFEVADIRQFTGRTSTGVRGIRLSAGDEVVAMSIIERTDFSPEERELYLRQASRLRRGEEAESENFEKKNGESLAEEEVDDHSLLAYTTSLSPERFEEMAALEQFILTVSTHGFGKRTSAYAYRRTNRGGQGVATMEVNVRNGLVLNAFPVQEKEHIILVTTGGQLIRCPVYDIRIAGRKTQGVTIFRLSKDDKVVSVVPVQEMADIVEEEPPAE
jgi:DNA gyrase subunit A